MTLREYIIQYCKDNGYELREESSVTSTSLYCKRLSEGVTLFISVSPTELRVRIDVVDTHQLLCRKGAGMVAKGFHPELWQAYLRVLIRNVVMDAFDRMTGLADIDSAEC